jgi:hypothetical protein
VTERSDAPLADEPQPGSIPDDMPSGLPDQEAEATPLGTPEEDPDTERGPQPGMVPDGGEPPSAG